MNRVERRRAGKQHQPDDVPNFKAGNEQPGSKMLFDKEINHG